MGVGGSSLAPQRRFVHRLQAIPATGSGSRQMASCTEDASEDPEAGEEADKSLVDLLRNLLGRRGEATSAATAEKRLRLLPLALPPDAQAHAARTLLWHLSHTEGQSGLVDDVLLGSAGSEDQQACAPIQRGS